MNGIHITEFYKTTLEEFIFAFKIIEQFFLIKRNKKQINLYIHI